MTSTCIPFNFSLKWFVRSSRCLKCFVSLSLPWVWSTALYNQTKLFCFIGSHLAEPPKHSLMQFVSLLFQWLDVHRLHRTTSLFGSWKMEGYFIEKQEMKTACFSSSDLIYSWKIRSMFERVILVSVVLKSVSGQRFTGSPALKTIWC